MDIQDIPSVRYSNHRSMKPFTDRVNINPRNLITKEKTKSFTSTTPKFLFHSLSQIKTMEFSGIIPHLPGLGSRANMPTWINLNYLIKTEKKVDFLPPT